MRGIETGTLVACLAVKFARPGTNLFSRDPVQNWAADTARSLCVDIVALPCVGNRSKLFSCLHRLALTLHNQSEST